MLAVRGMSRPYATDGPARADFEEAATTVRRDDDPLVLGYVLSHYGLLLRVDGDATRARALHEETLAIARAIGDENLRAEAHYNLAMDATSMGDFAAARSHLELATQHYQAIDHIEGVARCLGALAALALARGHERLAARLIGVTTATRDTIGLLPWPVVAEAERRTVERAESLQTSGEFAAQVAFGRSQTIEDVLTEARQALGDQASTVEW
jgi:tetratricopeptide (TPR) repeat protein